MRFGPTGIQDRQGTKDEPKNEDANNAKHRRLGLASGTLQVREVERLPVLVIGLPGLLRPKPQLVVYRLP